MTTRKRSISPDPKGRYRPYIGKHHAADGELRPYRFNLGTDRKEAERRYNKLQELYDDNCKIAGDSWAPLALAYAQQIACGATKVQYIPTIPDDYLDDPATEYAQVIEDTKHFFPSLDIQPDDPDRYAKSAQLNREMIARRLNELQAELQRLGALAAANTTVPDRLIPGTLHEALAAYQADFEKTCPRLPGGHLKQGERKRIERVARFTELHADCPLHELNKGKIEELAAYWRNRPTTKRKNRSSISNAENHLAELFRFLDWLDGSEQYHWSMPKRAKKISRKVEKFQHEKKLAAVTKLVYSPEQLATINGTATDRERLALYLGLNCAMGAAELGRLLASDFYLGEPHPYPQKLRIESTHADNYLRYFRPKTEVFGEWSLWPETVELVTWAIARARKIGTELLFCRETGRPLYDEATKKPDAGFANLWNDCRNRSGIKIKLPFGSLRDTLPDYLRAEYDSELASLCLTHGTPGVDGL